LNSDLQHLIQLQELDLASERVRRRIEDIPSSIASLDSRLTERTTAVSSVKERMAASQGVRREIDKELAGVQARLSKYKGQLMEVKTNKEYQAVQHEMQVTEQQIRAHEDRLLEIMEEQEGLAAELKEAEAALGSEQKEIARERQQIEGERAELDKILEQQTKDRAALTPRISAPVLALFERIATHRRGIGLSEARDGTCMQCHVRLRPQVFNEVRRNDSLHQCDSCSRILYYVPVTAGAATPTPSN
jgi:predicted  nucleic acid-binding Zn-ribbon protein